MYDGDDRKTDDLDTFGRTCKTCNGLGYRVAGCRQVYCKTCLGRGKV